MGEFTICNYCSLQNIKRRTPKGWQVLLKPAGGQLGGVNVYRKRREDELVHERHFVAWYMETSDRCVC